MEVFTMDTDEAAAATIEMIYQEVERVVARAVAEEDVRMHPHFVRQTVEKIARGLHDYVRTVAPETWFLVGPPLMQAMMTATLRRPDPPLPPPRLVE